MQYSRGTLHLKIRLNLHVWCIDLSIHLRRFTPRARGFAEQAQSIERKRFKEPTGLLLWAREAGPRTKLPAEETSGAKGWGFPILGFKISFTMWYEDSDGKNRSAAGPFAAQTFCCRAASGV